MISDWVRVFSDGGKAALKARFPNPGSRKKPPPPNDLADVAGALEYAGPKPGTANTTYGRYLSDALAVVVANGLRDRGFDGVLPDAGGGFESAAQGVRGPKKLDVNYSTSELGLGLGVSIKTISFPDKKSNRYTKNYSRNDNELRAEAMDYHVRQPFAVLAALVFLPIEACDDASAGKGAESAISSFGAAVKYFHHRSGRREHGDAADLFEAIFIGLYDDNGTTVFYDVDRAKPPRDRRPTKSEVMDLDSVLGRLHKVYSDRNAPPWDWASS